VARPDDLVGAVARGLLRDSGTVTWVCALGRDVFAAVRPDVWTIDDAEIAKHELLVLYTEDPVARPPGQGPLTGRARRVRPPTPPAAYGELYDTVGRTPVMQAWWSTTDSAAGFVAGMASLGPLATLHIDS
jgi:hypothetical protein